MDDLVSAPGQSIQRGPHGTSLTPSRSIAPVWGEITGKHPGYGPDHHFQWRQVYREDTTGETNTRETWEPTTDLHGVAHGGYGSEVVDGNFLLNPAVESNFHEVEVGSIVRLIPSRVRVDGYQRHTHRYWTFSHHELRPFRLLADLVPTGGAELDTVIDAEWLDQPGETVTLYPEHRSGFPSGDQFLSLGIGRGPGAYFRGTYGWARYQPRGTAYTAADGTQKWRGEWQIVTLYADSIAQVVVYDATIEPGVAGKCQLFWIDKHADAPSVISSGYQIDVFNDLPTPLDVGDVLKVHFSRHHYVWMPLVGNAPPASPAGLSLYNSSTTAASSGTWAAVAFDGAEPIADFGNGLEVDDGAIKNVAGVPLVGMVEWSVSATRFWPANPADVMAVMQAGLWNAGSLVPGSVGQVTSSRRTPPADDPEPATNSISGHIPQVLLAGKKLEVKVCAVLQADGNDQWITLPEQCNLTFVTIPGAVLNED